MISFRVTLRRSSEDAAIVVFSMSGASTESFGVLNRMAKELKCVQLHFMWFLSKDCNWQPYFDQAFSTLSQNTQERLLFLIIMSFFWTSLYLKLLS